jgi:hypothetical protein
VPVDKPRYSLPVNQQKLSDNKLRLIQQNLKLFTALTKQRVKIINLPAENEDDEIIFAINNKFHTKNIH